MSGAEQNVQIKRYLLRQMADQERVDFEARYLADEELFTAVEVVEDEMIHSYLEGTQSESEKKLFVSQLLHRPGIQKRMEFATSLRDYLDSAYVTDEPALKEDSEQASSGVDLMTAGQSPGKFIGLGPFAMKFAMALCLMVALLGLGLTIVGTRLSRQIGQMRAAQENLERQTQQMRQQLSAMAAKLDQNRKEETLPDKKAAELALANPASPLFILSSQLPRNGLLRKPLAISRGTTHVALQMNLPFDDYPVYSAILETGEGERVWGKDNLKSSALSEGGHGVLVKLPAKLFQSRNYVMRLAGETADGRTEEVAAYVFRTVKR
jgi:hypothetical protein